MWRRSFIFLVVLAFALSSLSAYPAWMYGGSEKKATATAEGMPKESSEASPDLTPLEEPEPNSSQDEILPEEESAEPMESLKACLSGLDLGEAELELLYSYLDMIDEGIRLMEDAYNQEVAEHEDLQGRYNRLVETGVVLPKKESIALTFSPYATYSHKTGEMGVGASMGIGWKGLGLTVGAMKPAVTGLDSFREYSDLVVSAGLSFTF